MKGKKRKKTVRVTGFKFEKFKDDYYNLKDKDKSDKEIKKTLLKKYSISRSSYYNQKKRAETGIKGYEFEPKRQRKKIKEIEKKKGIRFAVKYKKKVLREQKQYPIKTGRKKVIVKKLKKSNRKFYYDIICHSLYYIL